MAIASLQVPVLDDAGPVKAPLEVVLPDLTDPADAEFRPVAQAGAPFGGPEPATTPRRAAPFSTPPGTQVRRMIGDARTVAVDHGDRVLLFDARWTPQVFTPGARGVIGLALCGNRLVIAEPERLVFFDLDRGAVQGELLIPGGVTSVADVLDDPRRLYVATERHGLHLVDAGRARIAATVEDAQVDARADLLTTDRAGRWLCTGRALHDLARGLKAVPLPQRAFMAWLDPNARFVFTHEATLRASTWTQVAAVGGRLLGRLPDGTLVLGTHVRGQRSITVTLHDADTGARIGEVPPDPADDGFTAPALLRGTRRLVRLAATLPNQRHLGHLEVLDLEPPGPARSELRLVAEPPPVVFLGEAWTFTPSIAAPAGARVAVEGPAGLAWDGRVARWRPTPGQLGANEVRITGRGAAAPLRDVVRQVVVVGRTLTIPDGGFGEGRPTALPSGRMVTWVGSRGRRPGALEAGTWRRREVPLDGCSPLVEVGDSLWTVVETTHTLLELALPDLTPRRQLRLEGARPVGLAAIPGGELSWLEATPGAGFRVGRLLPGAASSEVAVGAGRARGVCWLDASRFAVTTSRGEAQTWTWRAGEPLRAEKAVPAAPRCALPDGTMFTEGAVLRPDGEVLREHPRGLPWPSHDGRYYAALERDERTREVSVVFHRLPGGEPLARVGVPAMHPDHPHDRPDGLALLSRVNTVVLVWSWDSTADDTLGVLPYDPATLWGETDAVAAPAVAAAPVAAPIAAPVATPAPAAVVPPVEPSPTLPVTESGPPPLLAPLPPRPPERFSDDAPARPSPSPPLPSIAGAPDPGFRLALEVGPPFGGPEPAPAWREVTRVALDFQDRIGLVVGTARGLALTYGRAVHLHDARWSAPRSVALGNWPSEMVRCGNRLVVVLGEELVVIDLDAGERLPATFAVPGGARLAACAEDPRRLYVSSRARLLLVDAGRMQVVAEVEQRGSSAPVVADGSGRWLLVGGRVRDATRGLDEVARVEMGDDARLSPDGRLLFSKLGALGAGSWTPADPTGGLLLGRLPGGALVTAGFEPGHGAYAVRLRDPDAGRPLGDPVNPKEDRSAEHDGTRLPLLLDGAARLVRAVPGREGQMIQVLDLPDPRAPDARTLRLAAAPPRAVLGEEWTFTPVVTETANAGVVVEGPPGLTWDGSVARWRPSLEQVGAQAIRITSAGHRDAMERVDVGLRTFTARYPGHFDATSPCALPSGRLIAWIEPSRRRLMTVEVGAWRLREVGLDGCSGFAEVGDSLWVAQDPGVLVELSLPALEPVRQVQVVGARPARLAAAPGGLLGWVETGRAFRAGRWRPGAATTEVVEGGATPVDAMQWVDATRFSVGGGLREEAPLWRFSGAKAGEVGAMRPPYAVLADGTLFTPDSVVRSDGSLLRSHPKGGPRPSHDGRFYVAIEPPADRHRGPATVVFHRLPDGALLHRLPIPPLQAAHGRLDGPPDGVLLASRANALVLAWDSGNTRDDELAVIPYDPAAWRE